MPVHRNVTARKSGSMPKRVGKRSGAQIPWTPPHQITGVRLWPSESMAGRMMTAPQRTQHEIRHYGFKLTPAERAVGGPLRGVRQQLLANEILRARARMWRTETPRRRGGFRLLRR